MKEKKSMLFNLGTWMSKLTESADSSGGSSGGSAGSANFVLLTDAVSFLLLSDSTSKLMRP